MLVNLVECGDITKEERLVSVNSGVSRVCCNCSAGILQQLCSSMLQLLCGRESSMLLQLLYWYTATALQYAATALLEYAATALRE